MVGKNKENLDDVDDYPMEPIRRRPETMQLVPIVFVVGIISTLYVIYVFFHCWPMLQLDKRDENQVDDALFRQGLSHLIVFNVITLMLVICYVRSICTSPGEIPGDDPHWQYVMEDALSAAQQQTAEGLSKEKKRTGDRRHCKWCGMYKPDRCHHCRVCRTCVLKMDHHCPWIYNCVGFRNYKFFFLLLMYTVLDLQWIFWTMFPSVWNSLQANTDFSTMFFCLYGQSMAAFLAFFITTFWCFHIWLMSKSMTTIEFCEKSLPKTGESSSSVYSQSKYNVGCIRNIQLALGDNLWLALLPTTPTLGSGLRFQSIDGDFEQDADQEATKRKKGKPAQSQSSKSGARASRVNNATAGGGYYGSMEDSFLGGPAPGSTAGVPSQRPPTQF